jgi:hypothetical protein
MHNWQCNKGFINLNKHKTCILKDNNGIIGKLVRLNKWVCNAFINNYKNLIIYKTIINVIKQSMNS